MKLQRWKVEEGDDHWTRPDDDGEWVKVEDAEKLEEENTKLNKQVDDVVDMIINRYEDVVCPAMQKRIDELEEENTKLKAQIEEERKCLAGEELCSQCKEEELEYEAQRIKDAKNS